MFHQNACGIRPNILPFPREGNRDKVLATYTSLDGEAGEFPQIIKLADDGNLQCVATAQNNSNIQPTVSKDHYLKVIGGSLSLQGHVVHYMSASSLR